jgi:hypothetical protein
MTHTCKRCRITNVAIHLDDDDAAIATKLCQILGVTAADLIDWRVVRRALDARKKTAIHFICNIECQLSASIKSLPDGARWLADDERESLTAPLLAQTNKQASVVVVGAGPAGLFAALALAEAGLKVTLLERGKPVETRMRDIGRLRSRGELNPESNICFGEGGAGTYTDGKLYTRVKHPYVRRVLHTFVRFGAAERILVDAHPHLGTDVLVRMVRRMREHLLAIGVDYRFEARVDDILLRDGQAYGVRLANDESLLADHVILATGHSARDTFARMQALGIVMEAKSFAVGVRAEHPQALINRIQYGAMAEHPSLGAAEYALTHQAQDQHLGKRGVYSFCMCPGGLIVPSPSEHGLLAINGMSNAKRSGQLANSGIVVQVTPDDIVRHGLAADPLCGIALQRELEQRAFAMTSSPYRAPAMRLSDFVNRRATGQLASTSYKPGIEAADLWQLFPHWLAQPLAEGLQAFDRRMRGYHTNEANLLAVESRTSSPLRVVRGKDMQSMNIRRLYPVGEGAGYAGGIVSAAVDGLKAAALIAG